MQPGIEGQILPDLLRQFGEGDHVGDRQAPAGLERAEGLQKDLGLVRRQVDDAVGDDDIGGPVRHRQVLDLAQAKLGVAVAAGLGIGAGLGDHRRGHVR